jgi:hypothetical protein
LHTVASRDRRVARLLRDFSERMAQDTRARIEAGRREGKLAASHDPDLSARLLMVIIAGLAHVDTLYPSLTDNAAWRSLVEDVVRELLGIRISPRRTH